jgi:hypothetical protein
MKHRLINLTNLLHRPVETASLEQSLAKITN